MKSIFAKYITIFASVLLVSFLMLTSIIATTIKNHYDVQAREEVERVAAMASDLLSRDWQSEIVPPAFQEDFRALLGIIGNAYNGSVNLVLTDRDGNIRGYFWEGEEGVAPVTKVDSEVIAALLRSENDSYSGFTTLGGVLKQPAQVYGKAIYHTESHQVVGAVFASSAKGNSQALMMVMNQSVFMSSLWVMLAALVAVYFVTDRLVRPIKSMSAAAKQFGKGNFESHVTVTGKDEIAELADTFNQMADSLAQQEKMRNSFLANVSHDLRTPMTAIAGFIDGINSGAIPPEKHEYYLGIISSEIHRLSRLVSQILDISRLDSGERKFNFIKCDICETARIALLSFEQKIDAKKLNVEFEAEEDSLYANADKDAVHQVIYNLIENAIKFSREEGTLRIALWRAGKHRLSFRVFNEGVGISAEDLPYVFNRFYKSDKSRGLDKNGVGLGLYIVKSIVDAHNGVITVDSQEGENCTFTVTLNEFAL